MKFANLEHVLRASQDICQESEFIVIGSQSLHGKYPDLPDQILVSMEVDLIVKNRPEATQLLNNIGVYSPFHLEFGYYADPVDFETATLPRDWRNRLVHLKTTALAHGAQAYCLHPHDLAVSKIAAWREKDKLVLNYLLDHRLIAAEAVLKLIAKVQCPPAYREDMAKRFDALVKATQVKAEPPQSPRRAKQ